MKLTTVVSIVAIVATTFVIPLISNPVRAQGIEGDSRVVKWIFDPRLELGPCKRGGGSPQYEGGRYHGCRIPENRKAPWLQESATPVVSECDTPIPANLPPRMFRYPSAARGPVDGTVLYLELVCTKGLNQGTLAFRNHVQLQRQACQSATPPERGRPTDQGYSRYGFSYRGGSRGNRYYYDYRSPRLPITGVRPGIEEAQYADTVGLCGDFNAWYASVYGTPAYGSASYAPVAQPPQKPATGPYRNGGPGDRLPRKCQTPSGNCRY